MSKAWQNWKSALWLLGIRGTGLGRFLRLVSFVLVTWSLLAWGAALALIKRVEIANADVIVVLSNPSAYQERTWHAAQLWKTGRAPRVLLTNENLRSSWSEAEQRNPLFTERATEALKSAGVPPDKIEVLPQPVSGTVDEAVLLREYAQGRGLRSILIVTSAYHSRRALWTFRNVFRDSGIEIGLDHVAPGLQTPTPATWWLKPAAWKIVALEYPKLLYYRVKYRSISVESLVAASVSGPEVKVVTGRSQSGLTLAVAAPVSAYTDEVVLIDARKSVGVPKRPQSDGTPSVTIDFGDGFTCNLLASGHAFRKAGTYTITVTAKSASGSPAAPVTTTIQVSDIPAASGINISNAPGQNLIDMTNARGSASYYIPETGYRNATANAAKLQAAIKRAAANNRTAEQEIVLPAGAVFAGPITLPTSVGNKYITIRSGSLSSLPAGNRVGPGQGGLMPVITAPSSTTPVLAALETTKPAPVNPPHHYRIQGIHLKKDDETKRSATLMNIGTDGVVGISRLPHHFIVDRCWFDGGASDTSEVTNGLRIYANSVSVVDSYAGDFRLVGGGVDTAAITPVTGQGPLAFVNNTMIATSENFNIAGGAAEIGRATISNGTTTSCTLSNVTNLEIDQNIALPVGGSYSAPHSTIIRSISGNSVTFDAIASAPDNGGTAEWIAQPSFIEFRRNYLYKPLRWWPSHPTWNGITYQIKNLWETKFSRYVVVDGNVMENSWIAAQAYAIALTVRNQNGGESPAAAVRELQFSNNIIRNAGAGVNLLSDDYFGPTQRAQDITFRNNLFQNVGSNFDATGAGHMLINMQNGSTRLRRIFLIHNTHDNGTPDNSNGMITDFGDNGGADESMWMNNVHQHGGYGFRSNFSVVDSVANISRFLPPGNTTVWNRNVVVNKGDAKYPASGIYLSGSWPKLFVDYANGNFALAPGMRGKGGATDGTDIGVDMAALIEATAGTKTGSSGSIQSTRPRRVSD
jgi:uncharacterized SAM-binding protein YcdF (DUF218 family)/PKD repeat protein